VQLYHVPAANPLVQPIHVLRHEGEARDPTLELCERQVSRGRIGLRHEFAPPLVALPHQAWIPVGSLSGREPLKIVALPEPCLGLAEGWHPALSRDPRARKRDHALGVAEGSDQVLRDILRADLVPAKALRNVLDLLTTGRLYKFTLPLVRRSSNEYG
jgi:hypothetical protein